MPQPAAPGVRAGVAKPRWRTGRLYPLLKEGEQRVAIATISLRAARRKAQRAFEKLRWYTKRLCPVNWNILQVEGASWGYAKYQRKVDWIMDQGDDLEAKAQAAYLEEAEAEASLAQAEKIVLHVQMRRRRVHSDAQ